MEDSTIHHSMEDSTIHHSKRKISFEECSCSSCFDPDIIETPPPTWNSESSEENLIIGQELVLTDNEDADDDDDDVVVTIDEKVVSNDKGKKPMLDYSAGLDDAPSPRVEGPNLSLVDGNFESNNSSGAETSEKHAADASSSSVSGTRTSSKLYKPVKFIKSLAHKSSVFKSSCFGSMLRHPGASKDAQTDDGDASHISILKKLEQFKIFDYLEDHSGHMFEEKDAEKPSTSWVKRIFDEWSMLENGLPDSIFVRVYEARMDLVRAAILGVDGTPYHDGIFFFDVHFAASYPNMPPIVKYHAHGLQINPNLYSCGKVCLSLLGTWSGYGVELWHPCKSNLLQVLVSIQGLVLNARPAYNEPGHGISPKHIVGDKESKSYNEEAYILSLKTMIYTMRNPPKHFEDLVYGHFYNRAHDILAACRAYLEGVEVGSYVKGKTKTKLRTKTGKSKGRACSRSLETSLPTSIKNLVEAFTKIGVKDCEKYLVSEC